MKAWADLSSAERLDAILLAIAAIEDGEERHWRHATGNTVAYTVQRSHPMSRPRSGNHGRGNVARQMADAVRVTPGLTALRGRGLVDYCRRADDLSGLAYALTDAGRERVAEIRAAA